LTNRLAHEAVGVQVFAIRHSNSDADTVDQASGGERRQTLESSMAGPPRLSWARGENQFHVACRAAGENRFCLGTESVSVTVGQLIQRYGGREMWDSVSVYAKGDHDGTLVIRVIVFSPDWDEPLQIACIRSRPREASTNGAALECNLDHIKV